MTIWNWKHLPHWSLYLCVVCCVCERERRENMKYSDKEQVSRIVFTRTENKFLNNYAPTFHPPTSHVNLCCWCCWCCQQENCSRLFLRFSPKRKNGCWRPRMEALIAWRNCWKNILHLHRRKISSWWVKFKTCRRCVWKHSSTRSFFPMMIYNEGRTSTTLSNN